jgi:hypothetical protein
MAPDLSRGNEGNVEYIFWLAVLALAILALSVFQLQAGRNRRMQGSCLLLQADLQRTHDELRESERRIDHLQRSLCQHLKWKDRAFDLEEELRATKQKEDYRSAERLQYLEDYVASGQKNPSAQFLATFQPRAHHSFEDRLLQMVEGAKFEVVIASPWIKRQMWDKMKIALARFGRRGGRLLVFMRGLPSDFAAGMSDDIRAEVEALGGEILFMRELHAKIYLVDRREAIVASANLTRSGVEDNYEAGIWLNDPGVLLEICTFVDDLYHYGRS